MPANELVAEGGGEEGVFAVGLLAAAPAGVSEDVDVGGPDGEAEVDAVDVVSDGLVVLGAGFGGDDGADLFHQGGVHAAAMPMAWGKRVE